MKREVKIGIFAVIMIAALWAGIRFLQGLDIFSRNATYYVAYDQVDGVQTASPVMIRGVKVGSVTDIRFDPAVGDQVVLQLSVQRQYPIPVNSEARIYSASIMGSKAIEIELGDAREYLGKGDTIRSGRSKDLMDVAGSELEFFKQKISQVVADLGRTMDNLNGLMERNAPHIDAAVSHLSSISGSVDGMLLAQRENLAGALEGLARFSQMLGDNSSRVDGMLSDLNAMTRKMADEDLAGSLASSLNDLGELLARVERGEGTLGRIMNDPALYASLEQASDNLGALLEDLKARPTRYVHFSLFGRDPEKAARRQQTRERKQARKDSLALVRAQR
ncbi:MAG: MlaD family protein [Alistipes sp.]|nr:MlaD family protein [Alistipes sp.]